MSKAMTEIAANNSKSLCLSQPRLRFLNESSVLHCAAVVEVVRLVGFAGIDMRSSAHKYRCGNDGTTMKAISGNRLDRQMPA